MIITEQAVKDMINTIEIVEAEIKTATDLFSRAKKYLRETPLTELDVDYFDENFASPLNKYGNFCATTAVRAILCIKRVLPESDV